MTKSTPDVAGTRLRGVVVTRPPPLAIALLVPSFNEGARLASTLAEIAASNDVETGARFTVFLVDDGGTPPIEERDVAQAGLRTNMTVVLARHVVNLGQGASLETARRLALDPRFDDGFDVWVTMDADGQHSVRDVLALARAIMEGADVALGDRFAGGSNVPASRRTLLAFARWFEHLTTGLQLSDAHNGLRAFNRRALEGLAIRQSRMAHATEITRRIAGADLKVVEVPVSVRYSDESLAKGQSAGGAITILVDLFQGFLFGR